MTPNQQQQQQQQPKEADKPASSAELELQAFLAKCQSDAHCKSDCWELAVFALSKLKLKNAPLLLLLLTSSHAS